MQIKETKRIRNIMIYWVLSSVLFIIDAVLKALPAYNNPTESRLIPHLQGVIEFPILVNQNYLIWGIANFAGLASIILLIILVLRPEKSKDVFFIGLVPLIISIIALIYGIASFWSVVALIFNFMIAWNCLSLTGRIKQAFNYINRTFFKNTKIVTGMIWTISSVALLLDAVLRAFPESETDGVYQLVRGIIECIGAGFVLLTILLINKKIPNKIKMFVGFGPLAATFLGFLIGYPISMTSIWMWVSIVFSILTIAQFIKLYGKIKDIPTFNRKMNGLFWFLAAIMGVINAINIAFPFYNLHTKTVYLGWGIVETLLAVSILIPLPIYIYDSMITESKRTNIMKKIITAITISFQNTKVKAWFSIFLVLITGVALGWDLARDYLYYRWSEFSYYELYSNYIIPIVFNVLSTFIILILFYRLLIKDKSTKIDKITATLPLAFSIVNLFLYTNVKPLSLYISWVPVFLVSLFIFIFSLRGQEPRTSHWVMRIAGSVPAILAITSFIYSILAEGIYIWSWLSLVSGIFATIFAILVTGNANNQERRVIKFGKTWNVFKKNWMGITGLILLIVIIILAVGGSKLTKWDPDKYYVQDRLQAPSATHILGTNRYGQDVFTVLLDSLGISLLIGIIAGSLTVIVGTTIGVASAYIGGWVDNIIMRITDVILVMPALPLMLVLASLPFLFGKVHWSVIAVVYIVVFWPVSARLIRGQALSVKERAFVISAKSSGAGSGYIIFRHILPNVFPLMLTMIITSMRQAILYESFLSYLGLGDPLNWTLGQMLYIAQNQAAFASGAWWMFFPPGIAIGLITLSFAFIGMALDEIVNPRLRKR